MMRRVALGLALAWTAVACGVDGDRASSTSMRLTLPADLATDLVSLTLTIYGPGATCGADGAVTGGTALPDRTGYPLSLTSPRPSP